MKIKLLLLVCFLLSIAVSKMVADNFIKHAVVDVYPTLKEGGDSAFNDLIKDYKIENKDSITALVRYLVLPNGKIGGTEILEINPVDDAEIRHIVLMLGANMPEMTPGVLKGEIVWAWKSLKLVFVDGKGRIEVPTKRIPIGLFDVTHPDGTKGDKPVVIYENIK